MQIQRPRIQRPIYGPLIILFLGESFLVWKWWRQSTSLSTIRTRYGNSVSTPEATRTCKTQQNSLQKRSQYGVSVSTPYRRYGHVFSDAIPETSIVVISSWFTSINSGRIIFEGREETPTPKISALLRKRPVLLRANFRPY